jgi:hypothetical protein
MLYLWNCPNIIRDCLTIEAKHLFFIAYVLVEVGALPFEVVVT